MRSRTTLPAGVNTPAAARAFVRDAVARDAAVPVDDLTLVVSELVTNAVVTGTDSIDLEIVVDGTRVLVEVAERTPPATPLAPIAPLVDDAPERGLMLVSRLSRRWGVRRDGMRKVLWADLAAS